MQHRPARGRPSGASTAPSAPRRMAPSAPSGS